MKRRALILFIVNAPNHMTYNNIKMYPLHAKNVRDKVKSVCKYVYQHSYNFT